MDKKEMVEDLKWQLLLGHSVAGQNCDDAEYLAKELVADCYGNIEQAIKEFAEKVGYLFCPECDYSVFDIRKTIVDYGEEFINAITQQRL